MILAFDTETTGIPAFRSMPITSPGFPHLVELGLVLVDEDGHELQVIDLIIKPDGYEVPAGSSAVHGISNERALAVGVPLRLAVAAYTNLRRVARLLVGHNVEFDLRIMEAAMHRVGATSPDLITPVAKACTAILGEPLAQLPPTARMVEKGYGDKFKKPSLAELYRFLFDEELVGVHGALADCRAALRCFREIQRREAA